jgi:hypothetical protein
MERGRGSSLEREQLEQWEVLWKKGKEKVRKVHWVGKLQGWERWEQEMGVQGLFPLRVEGGHLGKEALCQQEGLEMEWVHQVESL